MSHAWVVLVVGVMIATTVPMVQGAVRCDASLACFPMSAPTCTRGNSINLRFFVDASDAYNISSDVPSDSQFTNQTITYAFCPRVDELQAFNLSYAPAYSALDPTNDTLFVQNVQDSYVSIYGFGESANVAVPSNESASRVMIVSNGSTLCGDPNSVLVADFLVFQLSMTNGAFTYPGAVAGYENVSAISKQPQGVGFQPTCTGAVCQLDATYKCIGDEGAQNCAKCYSNPSDIANMTVQVWMSYYGTDNNGRRLLSGGNNPLNFRKYSGGNVYNSLSNSINKVSTGESLDPTVPDSL